jgi:hypothetical protein
VTADTSLARRRPTWITVAVAGLIGLFYAYVVWSAVDLLIRQATGPLGLSARGWFVYLLAVLVPLVLFGVCFALGYRRPAWKFALVLLVGLTLAAAFWVNVLAYGATSFALYGG